MFKTNNILHADEDKVKRYSYILLFKLYIDISFLESNLIILRALKMFITFNVIILLIGINHRKISTKFFKLNFISHTSLLYNEKKK